MIHASRRNFLRGMFTPALLPAAQAPQARPEPAPKIYLNEYQPKSMLAVAEHRLSRAKFPIIDVHSHVSRFFGMQVFGKMLLNLTGGTGDMLQRNIAELQVRHKGRFLVCTEPSYARYADANYPQWQAEELERA